MPEIARLYRSERWRKLRKLKIAQNPVCERCARQGIYKSVEIVHHKEYVTDQNYWKPEIFYNIDNLECLCRECHNKEHFSQEEKSEIEFDENGDVIKCDLV